jgi:hypothetical protein
MAKIRVTSYELHARIDAALGDERVSEPCLSISRDSLCSQNPGACPISGFRLEHRQLLNEIGNSFRELWITEKFGEDHRRNTGSSLFKDRVDSDDVGAAIAAEVGCPGTGVDRDQDRSSRSLRKSMERGTRPRSLRRFAQAFCDATSSSPRRIVAVTPSPVDAWASRSRRSGNSTVTFFAAFITG